VSREHPTRNGRKPPPPVRTGRTRSTFDDCGFVLIAIVGTFAVGLTAVIYGAIRLIT
jgi:hypothetical protein